MTDNDDPKQTWIRLKPPVICQVYTHPQVILFPNLRTTIFSSCEVIAQQMLTVTHAIRARKELEMTSRVDRVFREMTSLNEDDFVVWILLDWLDNGKQSWKLPSGNLT